MTASSKFRAALVAVCATALSAPAVAQDFSPEFKVVPGEKPVVAEPASFNGYSCDMVRAKIAESGVTAAYAYARYMGLTSRDIARVRKACAV